MADDANAFESIFTFTERGDSTEVVLRTVFPTTEQRDHVVREYHTVEGGKRTLGWLAEYVKGVLHQEEIASKVRAPSRAAATAAEQDPIVRQIEDPARKLGGNDRLVGPPMDALGVEVPPVVLATGSPRHWLLGRRQTPQSRGRGHGQFARAVSGNPQALLRRAGRF